MFEIGNSLREARLRQHLDFPEAEQATKIRGKYLRALEDERFELLPAQTYVKGFLRAYAEYLGLDGQLYVDEFNSRYVTGEDEPPPASRRSSRSVAPRRGESRGVLVALGAIGVVTALVIAAWRFGAPSETGTGLGNRAPAASSVSKRTKPARPAKKRRAARPVARIADLVVTAAHDRSWLEVRQGSATGPQLFAGTLEHEASMRFRKRRLWINVGRPASVVVRLNGARKPLRWSGQEPLVAIVSSKGIRPVRSPG